MAKAMRTKDFVKALLDTGCSQRPGKGSHAMFYCPCGEHSIAVSIGHNVVAPNAMRDVKHRMSCIQAKLSY